ncbi:hypothetical protein ACLOJK_018556 [Asimina triloba]
MDCWPARDEWAAIVDGNDWPGEMVGHAAGSDGSCWADYNGFGREMPWDGRWVCWPTLAADRGRGGRPPMETRWRLLDWADDGGRIYCPVARGRADGALVPDERHYWLGRKGWPALEKKGQRSSVVSGSAWRDGSAVRTSCWSSPPAAMAAGLGEGDGAPYGCSGGAP